MHITSSTRSCLRLMALRVSTPAVNFFSVNHFSTRCPRSATAGSSQSQRSFVVRASPVSLWDIDRNSQISPAQRLAAMQVTGARLRNVGAIFTMITLFMRIASGRQSESREETLPSTASATVVHGEDRSRQKSHRRQ